MLIGMTGALISTTLMVVVPGVDRVSLMIVGATDKL